MSLLKKLSQLEKKKKIIPSLLKQKSCPIKKKKKKSKDPINLIQSCQIKKQKIKVNEQKIYN